MILKEKFYNYFQKLLGSTFYKTYCVNLQIYKVHAIFLFVLFLNLFYKTKFIHNLFYINDKIFGQGTKKVANGVYTKAAQIYKRITLILLHLSYNNMNIDLKIILWKNRIQTVAYIDTLTLCINNRTYSNIKRGGEEIKYSILKDFVSGMYLLVKCFKLLILFSYYLELNLMASVYYKLNFGETNITIDK